jgi:dipeptidyl aminopeptidase/acylaminoacyl peptidase
MFKKVGINLDISKPNTPCIMNRLKRNVFMLSWMAGIIVVIMSNLSCSNPSNPKNADVPLIDRELFFDNPEIAGGQISPDGQWMSMLKPYKNVLNIWVKKLQDPFEKAIPITADTLRPIRSYFWTNDSKYILYVQDKGGNENFQVYAIDPTSPAEAATGVPPCKNLINKEGVRAIIYNVSRKNPNILWVGINDRDQAWHDLYELNIATGTLKLLRENKNRITGWDFDWDENLRLASRSNEDGSTELLRVDKNELVKIYECGPLETAYTVAFDAGNKKVYLITNKGEENNFTRLMQLDPASGKTELLESDPENKVDFGDLLISELTHEMIATTYTDSKIRKYWKDKAYEADYKFLESKFPGMEIDLASNDKTETKLLIAVSSDTDPASVYYFDRGTRELSFQYRPRPKLPIENLSKMQIISYKSSDGLEIPAYLTIPKGQEEKNLPLLVIPHGGPWARDFWGYNSYAQFFSNRGYAVLQMNFRGSTGYGKAFLDAGNRQWGDKMQDDITWGVKYLVEKGIADPKRIGILGGSYGGYATLAGVTFTPDLYSAAVAVVAPSNLITLLASIPPYWEAGRKIFHLRMGDPTNPEGLAQLERQSPLNFVTKIKTPLMVVQGANDPRVKKAEADQIVVAMRDNKIPVEYICAPDEGHGFARPVNNMAYLAASEKFLAAHLGGRYQESMKPEVSTRLKEITVDVTTMQKPEGKSK